MYFPKSNKSCYDPLSALLLGLNIVCLACVIGVSFYPTDMPKETRSSASGSQIFSFEESQNVYH